MDIASLSRSLQQREDGIWYCKIQTSVMYPGEGNSTCYELEENSYWFSHRNDCILSVIKKNPPSGPILDVGGGNGFVTQGIIHSGFEAILLEPGLTGVLNAKNGRHIPEVIWSTFEEAGFRPASLDAVGLFDVIEHIEDDRSFLREICAALKPGGLVYVTCPAHQGLWSASDHYAQHFRRYNRHMVEKLVEGLFRLEYFTYFFAVLVLPVFLLRTVPYTLRRKKQAEMMKDEAEHGVNGGVLVKMLQKILLSESRRIKVGKNLRMGTSCLWVGRKREDG